MARRVAIIGAPTDFGANRRGVDMGPSAIRYAGLVDQLADIGAEVIDGGNLRVPVHERHIPKPTRGGVRLLNETRTVTDRLADSVERCIGADRLPLVLGGDHSIAIGTLAGSSRGDQLGVLWLDAHADFNTPETSPSGNVHGMPLAASLGHGGFESEEWARAPGVREENLAWVGLRSLDAGERTRIHESDATAFTMADIDRRGIAAILDEALDVVTDGTDGIHVSLDLDWLEPTEAPGVGTPVPGGVTYREAHFAMERVAARDRRTAGGLIRSMDVVEVNPILDEANETAELAVALAASALGKVIL